MLFLVCFITMVSVGYCQEPTVVPVQDVDHEKICGRYYTVYIDKAHVETIYGNYQVLCLTSELTKLNETTLSYHTEGRNGSVNGEFIYSGGYWEKTELDGKFILFHPASGFMIDVSIVKLGPPDCEDDKRYSYYIMAVGADLHPYYVIASDVDVFKATYDKEVTEWLKDEGFNDPVAMEHPNDCVYED